MTDTLRRRVAEIYIWLIVHNLCLCCFGMSRQCGWLDDQLLMFQ